MQGDRDVHCLLDAAKIFKITVTVIKLSTLEILKFHRELPRGFLRYESEILGADRHSRYISNCAKIF